jgi:hypothetical protein
MAGPVAAVPLGLTRGDGCHSVPATPEFELWSFNTPPTPPPQPPASHPPSHPPTTLITSSHILTRTFAHTTTPTMRLQVRPAAVSTPRLSFLADREGRAPEARAGAAAPRRSAPQQARARPRVLCTRAPGPSHARAPSTPLRAPPPAPRRTRTLFVPPMAASVRRLRWAAGASLRSTGRRAHTASIARARAGFSPTYPRDRSALETVLECARREC